MKKGFMELVASCIIPEYPGWTAEEYAAEALGSGCISSDAKNPVQSLSTTLRKQVREGREPRIRAERIDGVYRYFPVSKSSASDSSNEDVVVQLSLSTQELGDIDNLVAVGKFDNRSSAIKWLVIEGIKSNRAYLDKVADARNQIERLKKEVTA